MLFNFQRSKGSRQDELSPEEKAAKQYCEQAFAHIDRFVDLKQAIDRMSKKDDPKLSGKQPDPSTEEVDGAKGGSIETPEERTQRQFDAMLGAFRTFMQDSKAQQDQFMKSVSD